MIKRNLGSTERVLRLMVALTLVVWVALRNSHDVLTPLALLIATALTLNFLFSRCYLWAFLGFNSCEDNQKGCPPPRQH